MIKTDILKKTERIASAVYLITSFFDEKEPLKWRLRGLASNLFPNALLVKDNSPYINDKAVQEIQNIIIEVDSLFLVAKRAGLVSVTNHEILSTELQKFSTNISDPTLAIEESKKSLLSKDFFGSSISATNFTTETKLSLAQNFLKDKIEETHVIDKGHKINEPKQLKEYSVVAVKKNSRQSTIINLLKRKKEIMIKDVSPLINGCSEKTIQRELMAMVHNGPLKKLGEKRWSRYSLA